MDERPRDDVPEAVPSPVPAPAPPPGWGPQLRDPSPQAPGPQDPRPQAPVQQVPGPYAHSPQAVGSQLPVPPPGWGSSGPAPLPRRPGERGPVVPLRPLGLGELLDGAVSVVRGYPRPVFAVAAVVAVLDAALGLAVVLGLARSFLALGEQQAADVGQVSDALGAAALGGSLAGLFAVFSALVLAGLVAPAVSRGVLGQPLTPRDLWQQLRPRLPALLGVALVVTLAVVAVVALAIGLGVLAATALGAAGGFLAALLIPAGLVLAAYLWVAWAFAPVCAVLEKQGVVASLRRSRLLVRRSWWRVFGVLLLTAVVAAVVSQVLQVPSLFAQGNPLDVLSATRPSTTTFVVAALVGMVAATVVGPFEAGVRGLLYVDRRIRAEGLDVALAAAAAETARRR